MSKNFINWIRRKLRNFLFNEDCYMGVDWGIEGCTIIMVKVDRRTGNITVLSEYNRPNYAFRDLDREIRSLCKHYHPKHIVKDYPTEIWRY